MTVSGAIFFSGFNWVTPVYDWLAGLVFGQRLQQAQVTHLDKIPVGASVLIVGGGTGWLLEQVLTRCRPARVVYLDTSNRMLARASRRVLNLPGAAPVAFQVGDESTLPPDQPFDVVITPFVLDLYTEPTLANQMIPRLRRTLKPGGLWLITDFVSTNVGWQKVLVWSMIRFFRLTAGIETKQLADWQKLLCEAGLLRLVWQPAVSGMVSAEVYRA